MRTREKQRIFKRFMEGECTSNLAYQFIRYMPEMLHGEGRRLLVEQAIRSCVWDEIKKGEKK